MFKIGQKEYELKYTIKRVELLERNLSEKSLMSLISKTGAAFSIGDLRVLLAFGLIEKGTNATIDLGKAEEMTDKLFEKYVYTELCEAVFKQIRSDCAFFPLDA